MSGHDFYTSEDNSVRLHNYQSVLTRDLYTAYPNLKTPLFQMISSMEMNVLILDFLLSATSLIACTYAYKHKSMQTFVHA